MKRPTQQAGVDSPELKDVRPRRPKITTPREAALWEARRAAAVYFDVQGRYEHVARLCKRYSEAIRDPELEPYVNKTDDQVPPEFRKRRRTIYLKNKRWEHALSLHGCALYRAREQLIEAIWAACGYRHDGDYARVGNSRARFKPCALQLDGRLYVVHPDDDGDGSRELLTVVDAELDLVRA